MGWVRAVSWEGGAGLVGLGEWMLGGEREKGGGGGWKAYYS